jgi:hypothetical protein
MPNDSYDLQRIAQPFFVRSIRWFGISSIVVYDVAKQMGANITSPNEGVDSKTLSYLWTTFRCS